MNSSKNTMPGIIFNETCIKGRQGRGDVLLGQVTANVPYSSENLLLCIIKGYH